MLSLQACTSLAGCPCRLMAQSPVCRSKPCCIICSPSLIQPHLAPWPPQSTTLHALAAASSDAACPAYTLPFLTMSESLCTPTRGSPAYLPFGCCCPRHRCRLARARARCRSCRQSKLGGSCAAAAGEGAEWGTSASLSVNACVCGYTCVSLCELCMYPCIHGQEDTSLPSISSLTRLPDLWLRDKWREGGGLRGRHCALPSLCTYARRGQGVNA